LFFEDISCEPINEPVNENKELKTILSFNSLKGFVYKWDFTLSKNMFLQSSNIFSKDLMYFSFGLLATAGSKEEYGNYLYGSQNIKKFYEYLGVNDYYISESHEIKPTIDTFAYNIAYIDFEDFNVLFVSSIANHYGAEWCKNFIISDSGNHKSYQNEVNILTSSIDSFITKNNLTAKPLKLPLTAYSKAGATSNILEKMIDDRILENKITYLTKNNFYCYTYSTPKSIICVNDEELYSNVFNIISSHDIISNLISMYGFIRIGIDIDIDIFNDNAILKVNELNNIKLEDFKECIGVLNKENEPTIKEKENGQSLTKWYEILFSFITMKSIVPTWLNIKDRTSYSNIEDDMSKIFIIIFDIDKNDLIKLGENLIKKINKDIINEILLNEEDIIFNTLKGELDNLNIEYDNKYLYSFCSVFQELIHTYASNLSASISVVATIYKNMWYISYPHTYEHTYYLLENYLN